MLFSKTYDDIGYHIYQIPYFPEHKHNQYELCLVVEGKIIHKYNGKKELLEKNQFVFITPNDCHEFIKYQNNGCVQYSFFMQPHSFETLVNEYDGKLYDIIRSKQLPHKFSLSENQISSILDIVKFTTDVPNTNLSDIKKSLIVKLVFTEWLKLSIHDILTNKTDFPDWFVFFLTEIRKPENFVQPINSLYKYAPYSSNQLQRLFKKYMRTTLVKYIKELRLNYAAELMKTTDMGILQIASTSGYDSLSYFNKEFKKYFGVIPSYFRKSKGVSCIK